MKDRIKLAEAMGWVRMTESMSYRDQNGKWHDHFDPFTDANDDYAVLVWAKTQGSEFLAQFMSGYLWAARLPEYEIGDFARAALRTLS